MKSTNAQGVNNQLYDVHTIYPNSPSIKNETIFIFRIIPYMYMYNIHLMHRKNQQMVS